MEPKYYRSKLSRLSEILYSTNTILYSDQNVLRFWTSREGKTKK